MKSNIFIYVFIISTVFFLCCKKERVYNLKSENEINRLLQLGKDKSIELNDRLIFTDSAFIISIKNPLDTLRLYIISTKSFLHLKKKQNDSFHFYNKLLAKNSKILDNNFFLGKAYFNLGYYFDEINYLPDSAFFYYNKSKNHFIKIGDSLQAGKKLLNMAILQNIQNDFFGAKETLTESLQYLKTSNNKKYLASVYNELATNNANLENYSEAINYYKKAINISNSKNDIISYKNNLALAYTETERYNESIILLKELLLDSLVKEKSARYARILHNLTYAQWRKKGETNLKIPFFKALKIRKDINDKRGQISSYLGLGKYFSKIDPLNTKKYLDTAIQLSKQLRIPKAETDALKLLMNLEPKNTILKNRYIFLKDSSYKKELTVKTQFAKMKYDDETKQKTILKLKAKQALEASKQYTQKIIYLATGSILLIAGGFIFFIIKQQHKKDKLQEVYTTETRISKKLHDELANNVYNVMNRIQNNTSKNQEAVLNQLDDIYKRTRNISHENSSINLDNAYYYLELKDMLNAYQSQDTTITTIGIEKDILKDVKNHKKIIIERVLKELMTNMKKHSNASNVFISIKKDKNTIKITYTDDGVGFKKEEPFKRNGLLNAENRIKNINGSFNFDTTKEKGVSIKIAFPA